MFSYMLYVYIYIYMCVCVCVHVCAYLPDSVSHCDWSILIFFSDAGCVDQNLYWTRYFSPPCFWSLPSPWPCVCVCVHPPPPPPWFHQYPQYGQNTGHDVMSLVWWQRWTTCWPRAAKREQQQVKRDGICLTPYSGGDRMIEHKLPIWLCTVCMYVCVCVCVLAARSPTPSSLALPLQ